MNSKAIFSMIPIEKTDIYRAVIIRIFELIDHQQMRPGDKLPSERELSNLLGVSRTTVRQGLKVIESMGRVETRIGSGTFVTDKNILAQFNMQNVVIDVAFIRDLCCAREGIEKTVFQAFLLSDPTAKQLKELENILLRQEKAVAATTIVDTGADVIYEFRFEEKVAEMTGNKILIYQQKQIHQLWSYAWAQMKCVPEKRSVLHIEHNLMFEAIRHKNWELLSERISNHVNKDLRQ